MCKPLEGLTAFRDRFYQDIADEISSQIPQGNILDVGTGRGLLPIRIARKNERLKIYGIDISKQAIAAARRDALSAGLAEAPRVEVGECMQPPFCG